MATAAADACVLIIRSTVADAVADWQALRDAGVQALLHHSRWADRDRQTLDSRVLDRLGERTRLPGSIVVGTQTLEQSLNIDADLLITDACPGDVLLQRLGRLWRFRLSRPPGCAHRRCVLIDPGPLDDYLSADPKRPQVGRAGQGWAWVYPLLPVAATLDWLEARGRIRVPDDARALVEAATHPEALEALSRRGDAWAVCHDHGLGATLAQRRIASASWIDETRHYAPDMEPEATTTRLGIGSVTVETPGLRSPLDGEPVPALPVPARWLEGIAAGTRAEANGSELRIGGVLLTYDERGLLRG